MKTFTYLGILLACAWLTGCAGGGGTGPVSGAPSVSGASSSGTIRVGDKITIKLSGVPDEGYFNEYQIPASGDINVPLLTQTFHAAGRHPADMSTDIENAYKAQKIYTNPKVTVLQEERYVSVGGDVRSPSRVLYSSDSTVMSSINASGGFDEYANKRAVRILRGSQVITVDCVKAISAPGADPAVYPGDQIYVPRSAF